MLPQGYDSSGQPRQPRQQTPPSPLDLMLQQQPQPPLLPQAQQPPARSLGGPAKRPGIVAPAPSYRLSRQVVTIPDLWREWTLGLGGLPSVTALDAAYGSRWRSPSERQFYSMRKVIIDEIMARGSLRCPDQCGCARFFYVSFDPTSPPHTLHPIKTHTNNRCPLVWGRFEQFGEMPHFPQSGQSLNQLFQSTIIEQLVQTPYSYIN